MCKRELMVMTFCSSVEKIDNTEKNGGEKKEGRTDGRKEGRNGGWKGREEGSKEGKRKEGS